MTTFSWIAMTLAGGLGAVLRLVVDSAVKSRLGARFPYGSLVVNLSGAFLLGLVTSAALPSPMSLIVGTGMIGAYTTFSTWMLQTYELADGRELRYAAANIVIPAAGGLAAAALGYCLGALV